MRFIVCIWISLFHSSLFSQSLLAPPFERYLNDPWVEKTLKSLSLEEKIAQLIWIEVRSGLRNKMEAHRLITKYKVGGIVYFSNTSKKLIEATNLFQEVSEVPLIVAMDGEWGVGMRLDEVRDFPYNMTLGAIQNNRRLHEMGRTIASHCRQLGIHVNFAPVADVNLAPDNPVIGFRSFGESPKNVLAKCSEFVRGLQQGGILATAKHFPGHGDTEQDSHKTLPVIKHSRQELKLLDVYPYQQLIKEGLSGIMSAHLRIPALDPSGVPASLSRPILTDFLRKELGFRGLLVTDAMKMKGVEGFGRAGEREAKALAAGNDVVELVSDVEKTIEKVKRFVHRRKISRKELNMKCRRVLAVKRWANLHRWKPLLSTTLPQSLNTPRFKALVQSLYEEAVTVLRNEDSVLPFRKLDRTRIAVVSIGNKGETAFQKRMKSYSRVHSFSFSKYIGQKTVDSIVKVLNASYDRVIVGIHGLSKYPTKRSGYSYGVTRSMIDIVRRLDKEKTVIAHFGTPYALVHFGQLLEQVSAVVVGYENNGTAQDVVAQVLFGGVQAKGRLPVSIGTMFPVGSGVNTASPSRLGYAPPHAVGLNEKRLTHRIDSIVYSAIERHIFPGCNVLVARKGKVAFHKTYGFHSYEKLVPTHSNDIYDIASVTKVVAATTALMKLYEWGKIDLDAPFSSLWKRWLKVPEKKDLTFREILAHQAGLSPYLSYFSEIMEEDGSYKEEYVSMQPYDKYDIRVGEKFYLHENIVEYIYRTIDESAMLEEKKYLYSGLSFLLYPQIVKNLTGQDFSDFLHKEFFLPLGAFEIGFNPKGYNLGRIVPCGEDLVWRQGRLHGVVHDPAAAIMGGISGNSGLFASANDLAKWCELLRKKGTYGKDIFFSDKTVREFTRIQYPKNENRRGLGFDKPNYWSPKEWEKLPYPCPEASPESFGHMGFTGTMVWIDPKYDLFVVMLSNRVYAPKNSIAGIRPAILQAAYQACENQEAF